MMQTVQLYDTTLRDGAQMEGMSLSLDDKILIAQKLFELGVDRIEGGFPGSNPRDAEFFVRLREFPAVQAKVVAFGGTRRAGADVRADPNIRSLVQADTNGICFVGKASAYQVRHILETTPEENLAMIADSIRYMKSLGKDVFFDAEHFFDGFFLDRAYAIQCLQAAVRAGADVITLCDTNGGMITPRLLEAIEHVQRAVDAPLGIHVHDDAGLAVANTLAAVGAGVYQVQGCINGYGERCGNANLTTVIADLKLKLGIDCVEDDQLAMLTEVSNFVGDVANLNLNQQAPYVGVSAFAHKAGYHVAAMVKDEDSYQHVAPGLVGNDRRVLVSELSGQRNISAKLQEQGIDIPLSREETRGLVEKVKLLESRGFQYDGAEASFELLVRRTQPEYRPPFELEDFMVVERRRHAPSAHSDQNEMLAEAMAKIKVAGRVLHTACEGNGPVNALDGAVRKALLEFFPSLAEVRLVDYKVRTIDGAAGTSAGIRVLMESTDGRHHWRTVGSSTDIIEASWLALADSLEYWLMRNAPVAAIPLGAR
jgi:2-isopropylmalate synthase